MQETTIKEAGISGENPTASTEFPRLRRLPIRERRKLIGTLMATCEERIGAITTATRMAEREVADLCVEASQ